MVKNHASFLSSLFGESGESKRRIILRSIKAKADAKRTLSEKIADAMTSRFGNIGFLLFNVSIFVSWLTINTGYIDGIRPFDPSPFILLTTFVSLEAIILAIFVLISQNRSMKVEDLREEVQLQIDLIAEKEIIKLMKMTALLLKKSGIDLSEDIELQKLLKPMSEEEIERILEKEILET